jgi:hypothetical protein
MAGTPASVARRAQANKKTMPDLFLITGIPGTGKTRLANALAKDFGFVHHDLEDLNTLNRLFADPAQFIADIVTQNKNTVVSWGFNPEHQLSVPHAVAAASRFLKITTNPESAFPQTDGNNELGPLPMLVAARSHPAVTPASPNSLPRTRSRFSTTLNCAAGSGSFLDGVYISRSSIGTIERFMTCRSRSS